LDLPAKPFLALPGNDVEEAPPFAESVAEPPEMPSPPADGAENPEPIVVGIPPPEILERFIRLPTRPFKKKGSIHASTVTLPPHPRTSITLRKQ
jgi:hypothetical protein